MPMLRITVTDSEPRLHGGDVPLQPALVAALAADKGPVTIMVHGYKYLPGHPIHCPHGSLMSPDPAKDDWKIVSWPSQLGLHGQRGTGVAISFGWKARGSIWAAHRRAQTAGQALAALVRDIRRFAPGRPVNLIAHSLGARVALAAIGAGAPGSINRAVLLAAAEYADTARHILEGETGRHTEVLNVTSRENDLYDFLLECLIPPARRGDRMLGHGGLRLPRMVTLQLDDSRSLAALRSAGFPIEAPDRLICHWSPYLRAGVFPLYRAVLSGEMSLDRLRALLPARSAPRWSRLRPRLPRPQPPLLPAE
ncbi:alpha/beta hydrolase [Mameliella sediminis]|uniref:alpha/beta hydrolase n=1 Tax=Mameliella sediminis TaxID=2836866 RepID=UPI001C479F71|nr:alpha/beta hydrolase [Mameliella sediminis]MBV7396832.1 alpha/beta hydrolase [Mameliella sediminis]MBY6116210.1 alpha/beta hydrolase [Antarctobacter heliothermus]MBY6146175.1 alpha/beta hydrolase [Mameliella alba]MCA0955360.1 alpha/beta hydrolase [Mameliella alba]